MRFHTVREDRIHLQRRNGLRDWRQAVRRERLLRPDQRSRRLGRTDGNWPQLLREEQSGHLQRQGALPHLPVLRLELDIRWIWRSPRLVLQLRRGYLHRRPQLLLPAALHRRAVARHRYLAVRA
ncbi:hypothetical protein LINGRAPRIM_LOCUS906 [Linum grandiflorum]